MLTRKSQSESYIHYYAKQVLMQWLRSSRGKFFSLRWHPFGDPIYDEYPLILVNNNPTHGPYDEVWPEIPSKICDCPVVYENLLLSSAINPCHHHLTRNDNIPSREEAIVYGHRIGAIVDVAIVDEGRLKYIFEVVHTSPVSPMKRKLLLRYAERFDCVVYEVDSDYILRQVCLPQKWAGIKLGPEAKPLRRFRRRWKGGKPRRRN